MTRLLALLLLAAGCAPTPPAPGASVPLALTFPSELPPEAALSVARRTLQRSGWRVDEPSVDAPGASGAPARAFTTGWRETGAEPLRLVVSVAETDGGASTVVTVRGERLSAGTAVPAVPSDQPGGARTAAWATIEAAAQRVGAEVRYARP